MLTKAFNYFYEKIEVNPVNFVIYFVISGIILFGQLVDILLLNISGPEGLEGFRISVSDVFYDFLVSTQNIEFVSNLILFLFMALIGASAFAVARLLAALIASLFIHLNTSTHYVHSVDYNGFRYWAAYGMSVAYRIVLFAAGLVYAAYWVGAVITTARETIRQFPDRPLLIIGVYLSLIVSMHVFVIIYKLLTAGWYKT